jgi:hypothetical protein
MVSPLGYLDREVKFERPKGFMGEKLDFETA